jgi:hypothetical protein
MHSINGRMLSVSYVQGEKLVRLVRLGVLTAVTIKNKYCALCDIVLFGRNVYQSPSLPRRQYSPSCTCFRMNLSGL